MPFSDPTDARMFLVIAAVFGLVMSGAFVVVIVWSMRRSKKSEQFEKRLGLTEDEGDSKVLRLWHDGKEEVTVVTDPTARAKMVAKLKQLPAEMGWAMPIQSVLLGLGGVAMLAALVTFVLTNNPLSALCVALAICFGFRIYIKQTLGKRSSMFEKQLVDALQLIARSLRAGHPLAGSFQLVAEELDPPVSTVFAEIIQQQELGISMEDALVAAGEGSNSPDLKLFATSIVIHLRSGGNLADMMERLGAVIQERIRLHRRVRVLTAQTQFSKRVLLAMPGLIFLLLHVIRPDYMEPLYTQELGLIMMAIAGGCMVVGSWMINRMARLSY